MTDQHAPASVGQCDREAAAAYNAAAIEALLEPLGDPMDILIQAFARHREAAEARTQALSPAAGVPAGWREVLDPWRRVWAVAFAPFDNGDGAGVGRRRETDGVAPALPLAWPDIGDLRRLAMLSASPEPPTQPAGDVGASIPPSDLADILETIEDAADDWQAQGYKTALAEVRDMAAVGRSLMDAIASAKFAGSPIEHWAPADDPAEIVTDLLNMLTDAALSAQERDDAK